MLNKKQIEQNYNFILEHHKQYLASFGVKMPALYENSQSKKFSKNALALILLAQDYPNTKAISKEQLTNFIRKYYPQTTDAQQGRHLGNISGFYIVSGTRGDSDGIPKGSYKLISLEKPHPDFKQERREGFSGDFEAIKKAYDYRCATCGSKEGQSHLIDKEVKVTLQQGHMNPNLPLQEGNIIPQCQICNRADRNRWVYDKKGRVIQIAITQDGARRVQEFLQNAKKQNSNIFKQICDYLKKLCK